MAANAGTAIACVDETGSTRYAWRHVWFRAIGGSLIGLSWCSLFWVLPLRATAPWDSIHAWMNHTLIALLGFKGYWVWVIKSYLMVALFIGATILCGYPPKALGLARLANHGWRIVTLCYLIALPMLIGLGLTPGMKAYYRHFLFAEGGMTRLATTFVILFAQHALVEGAIFAISLPGRGLQDDVVDTPRKGRLAFLGFGQPEGGQGLLSWLGTPAWVWPALIGNGLVFGMIHMGKDIGEIIAAFPGGVGLALLTWRIRSVWPSLTLHLVTAATILTTTILAVR